MFLNHSNYFCTHFLILNMLSSILIVCHCNFHIYCKLLIPPGLLTLLVLQLFPTSSTSTSSIFSSFSSSSLYISTVCASFRNLYLPKLFFLIFLLFSSFSVLFLSSFPVCRLYGEMLDLRLP
jgi:hypothetical protein